jgi:hypothetical protein
VSRLVPQMKTKRITQTAVQRAASSISDDIALNIREALDAARPRTHGEIAAAMWPDMTPASAGRKLRKYISEKPEARQWPATLEDFALLELHLGVPVGELLRRRGVS